MKVEVGQIWCDKLDDDYEIEITKYYDDGAPGWWVTEVDGDGEGTLGETVLLESYRLSTRYMNKKKMREALGL